MSRSLPERAFEATVTRGLLLAIGLGSLIQMPTQTPVVLLWFFILVAWLPFLIVPPRPLPVQLAPRHGDWPSSTRQASSPSRSGPLAVAERAKTFGREYVVGAYRPEPMEDQGQFRWTDDESRFVWPAPTRWFVIHIWAHHPDIARNPVRVTMTTPCGLLAEQDADRLRAPERRHRPAGGAADARRDDPGVQDVAAVRAWAGPTRRHLGVGIAGGFGGNAGAGRDHPCTGRARGLPGGPLIYFPFAVRPKELTVKEGIHPKYDEVEARCACGNTFTTKSTKPELHLEICSACHPFFTGRQKLIDTEGRVERFSKKFGVQTSEASARPPTRPAKVARKASRRSRTRSRSTRARPSRSTCPAKRSRTDGRGKGGRQGAPRATSPPTAPAPAPPAPPTT